MMKHNVAPEPSEYVLIGGTVYLKILPHRLEHLEIEHIKDDDQPDRLPAEMLCEENQENQKYMTNWYPDAESQQEDGGEQ
jgi:hypothetical protein